jgi:ubiquinone/menaquinone biosynthesis C-methylase UbiE
MGLDLSLTHLRHAARLVHRSGLRVPLVRADAERLPFRDAAFDVVFCDWGAMTCCDPYRTVPEASRVLRAGGCLAFATTSPLRIVAQNRRTNKIGRRLLYDYFDLRRVDYPREVDFALTYGDWVRLFRKNEFSIEALVETRPPSTARSLYLNRSESRWARHWPIECIWKVRKGAWSSEPAPHCL